MAAKKKSLSVEGTIIKLLWFDGTEPQTNYFTVNERSLAMSVAKAADDKGLRPLLYLSDYDGTRKVLYNYATPKKAAKKKVVSKKVVSEKMAA